MSDDSGILCGPLRTTAQHIDKSITPPRPRNAAQFVRVGLLVNK